MIDDYATFRKKARAKGHRFPEIGMSAFLDKHREEIIRDFLADAEYERWYLGESETRGSSFYGESRFRTLAEASGCLVEGEGTSFFLKRATQAEIRERQNGRPVPVGGK